MSIFSFLNFLIATLLPLENTRPLSALIDPLKGLEVGTLKKFNLKKKLVATSSPLKGIFGI